MLNPSNAIGQNSNSKKLMQLPWPLHGLGPVESNSVSPLKKGFSLWPRKIGVPPHWESTELRATWPARLGLGPGSGGGLNSCMGVSTSKLGWCSFWFPFNPHKTGTCQKIRPKCCENEGVACHSAVRMALFPYLIESSATRSA